MKSHEYKCLYMDTSINGTFYHCFDTHEGPSKPEPKTESSFNKPEAINNPSIPTPAPTPGIPVTSSAPLNPGGGTQIWCSGPSAPGYDVNTGTCVPFSTTTNAIIPKTILLTSVKWSPTEVRLSDLPNTGTNDVNVIFAFCFAVIVGMVVAYYSRKA